MQRRTCGCTLALYFLLTQTILAADGFPDVGWVDRIASTSDNTRLVVFGEGLTHPKPEFARKGGFFVWDLVANKRVIALEKVADDAMHGLVISPDRSKVAIAGRNWARQPQKDFLRFYDVATGERQDIDVEHENPIRLFGFSSDSTRLIYGTIKKLDPDTLVLIDLKGEKKFELSPNGMAAAACAAAVNEILVVRWLPSPAVEVYDAGNLKLKSKLKSAPIGVCLAVSNNGRFVATSAEKRIRVSSVDDDHTIVNLERPDGEETFHNYSSLAISPDGKWLAGAPAYTGRPVAELWNLNTKEMTKIGPYVSSVHFLADGTLAIGSTSDGLKLYDPNTQQEVSPPFKPVVIAPKVPKLEMRIWTSAGKNFTVKAKMISFADGVVKLETTDGRIVEVSLEKLSSADKKYVEQHQ